MIEKKDAIAIDGFSRLVVTVKDLERSRQFYSGLLGFSEVDHENWSEDGPVAVFNADSGGTLVLVQRDELPDLSATGVHQAYGVTPGRREAIADGLAASGIDVFTYKEDNPQEATNPFYTIDPDGNRIQITASHSLREGAPPLLDHAGIQVANLISAEWFYCDVLGLPVAHRVGWRTADYIKAQAWARGEEDMAPGTRRLDKRYTVMVNKKVVARVNMQLFVRTGPTVLAVYLANQHFQEAPEDLLKGSPRIGYRVSRSALDEVCRRLDAADCPHSGPIDTSHKNAPSTSLYCRDPGGNFFEFIATK